MPATVLGVWDSSVNQMGKALALAEFLGLGFRRPAGRSHFIDERTRALRHSMTCPRLPRMHVIEWEFKPRSILLLSPV